MLSSSMSAVDIHSSAIACGMILDEVYVFMGVLFRLNSATSLSVGCVELVEEGEESRSAFGGGDYGFIFDFGASDF